METIVYIIYHSNIFGITRVLKIDEYHSDTPPALGETYFSNMDGFRPITCQLQYLIVYNVFEAVYNLICNIFFF